MTSDGIDFPNGLTLRAPRLDLIDDASDTWSHGLDRFGDTPSSSAFWSAPESVDNGPLMASWIRHGKIGASDLTFRVRGYEVMQSGIAISIGPALGSEWVLIEAIAHGG